MMLSHVAKDDDIEIITPDIQSLTEDEHVKKTCSVCEQIFSNASALRLHMQKSHGKGFVFSSTESKNKRRMFACPSVGCPRNVKSPRQHFFRLLFELKKHYQSVHGEKKYTCGKCGKSFGWYASKETHENKCQTLFYCSCGAYYTTLEALKTHAYRRGKDNHRFVGEKKNWSESSGQVSDRTNVQSVTIPAILYIQKHQSLQNHQLLINSNSFMETQLPTQNHNHRTAYEKFIRILPKSTSINNKNNSSNNVLKVEVSKNFQDISPNTTPFQIQIDTNGPEIYCAGKDVQSETFQDVLSNKNIKQKRNLYSKMKQKSPKSKMSSYERNLRYLASDEVQQLFSDPVLMSDAILKTEVDKRIKNRRCRCKERLCVHIKKDILATLNGTQTSALPKTTDVYNEIGSTPLKLANLCTQTSINVAGIGDKSPETPSKSNTSNPLELKLAAIEVLETSDNSAQGTSDSRAQCQFSVVDELFDNTGFEASDMQTQTERDGLNSWLDSFCFSSTTNIETQTNSLTQNMVTQTDDFCDKSTPIFHDKSIQLDDIWSANNLFDSANIATQTGFDNWLNIDPIQNSMSTQTNCSFDFGFPNIDFSMQTADLISDSIKESGPNDIRLKSNKTETILQNNSIQPLENEPIESDGFVQAKSTTETQTSISFYDLLESSFIDDYLNLDKHKSSNFIQS